MELQPLGDRLIVEVLEEEETTTSGIVLPDTAKEKPQRGKILAVGPGSRTDSGEIVPMDERYVRDSILLPGKEIAKGYQNIMPSYAGQLSEEEIMQLIAYLKSIGNQNPPDESK